MVMVWEGERMTRMKRKILLWLLLPPSSPFEVMVMDLVVHVIVVVHVVVHVVVVVH